LDRRAFNSLLAVSLGGAVCAVAAAQNPATDCSASLQAGGLTEADFREYLAAFNRNDFEGFGRFYARDVIFEGRAGKFSKRDDVLNFYRDVKSRVRETLTLHDIVIAEQDIVADLETELYALKDWPAFPTGPIRKGQTIRSRNFIWYDVRDRRFVRIRSAHYRTT
jgi:hypothetical protein